MENGEKILIQLGRLEGKLDKNSDMTMENSKQILLMKQSLQGNGGKGLFQRMDERERWEKEHEEKTERKLELSRSEILRRRAIEVSIMGLIIGAIIAIANLLL